jgi:chromosome segregation ATPase
MKILLRARQRFEVDQFEYLKASADTVLLRLAGRWPEDMSGPDQAVLVVLGPLRPARLAPVPPAPAVHGGIWRAAYSAPLSLVLRPGVSFTLEGADGRRWPLPEPVERGSTRAQPADERAVAALRDELARAAAERLRLNERLELLESERAELERELAEVRAAAIDTHRSQQRLRDDLVRAEAELERLRPAAASREMVVQKVDRRLARLRERIEEEMVLRIKAEDGARAAAAAREHEVGQVRGELEGERGRAADLGAQLAAAREDARALREELAQREHAIRRARAGIDGSERMLGRLERDIGALREGVRQMVESAPRRLSPRASQDVQSAATLRAEIDFTATVLAQLEREAEAARDAIRARVAEARMVESA